MDQVIVKFAKMYDDVKIPSKREEDACFDIYAHFDENYIEIAPHETALIPTGLRSAFPSGYLICLKERGSTGTKGIGQRSGVVDSGYRGEWIVPITNHNELPLVIIKDRDSYDRDDWDKIFYPYEKAICQAALLPVPKAKIYEVSEEEILGIESERGEGRFGSSGK